MIKLEFENAVVKDDGFGLEVNGKPLNEIISLALGTRVGEKRAFNSDLSEFISTCCNVTVTIDPLPVTATLEIDETDYGSVEELEEIMREQLEESSKKENPEE